MVNLLPSINFDLVSRHIADYNAISNCKSVHTYQTNMCSHLAPGYKNYQLENYFTVPLLITHTKLVFLSSRSAMTGRRSLGWTYNQAAKTKAVEALERSRREATVAAEMSRSIAGM